LKKETAMRTSISTTEGESDSTESVCRKETTPLTVPIRDNLTQIESVALGLRQEMLSVGKKGELGSVTCGAGLGTDFIILEWKGRCAVMRGSELFKAWVATFDPKSAERMP
jgi:hypothetical protein